MPVEDQAKWDRRYSEGAYAERDHPSPLLVDWLAVAPPGRAADLACGRGRNSRYLAAQGYQVDGYDISPVGLKLAAGHADGEINWHQRDLLVEGLPQGERYALIIMFRFVALDLLAQLADHLVPGGVLVVENHLQYAQADALTLAGPGSARFRVAPQAQRQALGERLEILHEYEGLASDPDGSTVALAQLIARNTENRDENMRSEA